MYFRNCFCVIIIFLLGIAFHTAEGCWRKIARLLYRIAGYELDQFQNIASFTEYDINNFDLPLIDFSTNSNLFHYFGDINLVITTPKNVYLSNNYISHEVFNIFSMASNHLRQFFINEVHDYNTLRKILICCIEYSIRLRNTRYVDTSLNINCKRILGLAEDKLHFNYYAEKYKEDSIFETSLV